MKRIISVLFLLMSVLAFSENKIKIQVPLNLTDMYLYKNLDTGKYEGVYPEILEKVNEKYSVEYKLDGENPEILLRITNTEKYKNYNFISTPMTYRVMVLVNNKGMIRNISDLKGLKIAYIENSRGIEEFQERFGNLAVEKIKVANEDIGLEKLEDNTVDAFVVQDYIERNSFESHVRIIENILYREKIGVRKDCRELYDFIKEELLQNSGENLKNILKKNRVSYYKYLLKDTPNYNEVKEKYKDIKITVPKDKYALPIYYSMGGKYKGMLADILGEIEEILEIPVVITTENGNINSMVVDGNKNKEKYIISKPYYQGEIGIANRKFDSFAVGLSDLDNSKIIILKDSSFMEYIPKIVKNAEIVPVSTLNEGFQKLIKGEGDYFITFSSLLEGGITNGFLETKVKTAGTLNETFAVGFGVNRDEEELGQVIKTVMRGFATDKTVFDAEANNNILVAKNYKMMIKIGMPVVIFIIILIILYIKSERNRKKAEDLSSVLVETFESINQFDQEEAGDHAKRFSLYSVFLAEKLNLDEKKKEEIKKYTPLHDLGKVVIPNEILNKPGKLTPEEFEQVKKHTVIGYKLIEKLGLGKTAENIVKHHHEKWNGKGYPEGISGENIPIEARIAALADVYDNLRQDKVYRPGMTHEKAVEIIKSESGISFDPALVEIFVKENKAFEKIYAENDVEIYLTDEILTALKK